MTTPELVELVCYLIAVNAMTYGAYGLDDVKTTAGGHGISEWTFLLMAALGGSPATFMARRRLRHRTPVAFQAAFWAVVAMQVAAVLLGVWAQFSPSPSS